MSLTKPIVGLDGGAYTREQSGIQLVKKEVRICDDGDARIKSI